MTGTRVVIGVDVGGTTIAGGIVRSDGSLGEDRVVPTPRTPGGADAGAVATTALIDGLLATAAEDGLTVVGIGVGVPEYVTPAGLISSREVLDWSGDELGGDRWPAPVVIESDVRAAAAAEQRFGLGRDHPGFLFVSIGTGISHSLVLHGRVWPGHRGEALAIGEFPVRPELALRTEAPMTVERQASGRAIELATAERAGSPVGAIERTAGRIVAEALALAVRFIDPAAIVLGGGLGLSSGPFADSLMAHYEDVGSERPDPPPVLRSAVGKQGGIIGAGLAALQGAGP